MIVVSALNFLVLLLFRFSAADAIEFSNKETVAECWDILAAYSQANEWPNLSRNRAISIRTQRDISANVTVDYNVAPGVDLDSVLFEPYGYNADSLEYFRTLMNVGIQSFVINLYYDERDKNWLLCPKDKIIKQSASRNISECESSTFNLATLISTLNQFLTSTNNDLDINVMFLLLKLNSFSFNRNQTILSSFTDSNVTSLSSTFSMIEKVVWPANIAGSTLPTLNNLLFKLSQRVFPIVLENNLPPNSTYDLSGDQATLFSSTKNSLSDQSMPGFQALNMDIQKVDELRCQYGDVSSNASSLGFSYDTNATPFTLQSYWTSIQCGYSPILNHSFGNISDISIYLDASSWTWSPFQPTVTNFDELNIANLFANITDRDLLLAFPNASSDSVNASRSSNVIAPNKNDTETGSSGDVDDDDDDDDDDDEYINRCAVISKLGWIATTCDRKLYAVCVNTKNSSDYVLTTERKSYMKADIECKSIDEKYELALPRNVLEQQYIMSMIPPHENTLWINLNSLSSENCWVVGLNSNCPYQVVVSKHIFVQMITPSTVMAFLLFVLLFVLQFQRLPVHKNRKHWRKLLNEKLKNDYDGVPS